MLDAALQHELDARLDELRKRLHGTPVFGTVASEAAKINKSVAAKEGDTDGPNQKVLRPGYENHWRNDKRVYSAWFGDLRNDANKGLFEVFRELVPLEVDSARARRPNHYLEKLKNALEYYLVELRGHPAGGQEDLRAAQVERAGAGEIKLSQREKEILVALFVLKAEGERRSVSRPKAAKKADPASPTSSYNAAVVALTKKCLVRSKKGPNGGIWLTASGAERARQLQSEAK